MSKKELLKKNLGDMLQIFMFAKENYLYSEYLHNPATDEERNYLKSSPNGIHINFIRHSLFRTLIVELSKLYSTKENDKYRLVKLINRFKKTGDWKNLPIEVQKISIWESKITKNKDIIDKVLDLRDKSYAHTDSINNLNSTICFEEIETLLYLAEDIIKEIYSKVLDTHLHAISPKFNKDRFPLLNLLIIGEEEFKKQIMLKYSKRS